MSIASFVLSIISLIVSIVVAIVQVKTSIKLNKINMNAYYCEKIFNEYLIISIPKTRKLVQFNAKKKLIGTDQLIEQLRNMLKDSLFFKYVDSSFYNKLKNLLQELEDLLVSNANKTFETTEHAEIYQQIDELITKIYTLINNKRIDGSIKKKKNIK